MFNNLVNSASEVQSLNKKKSKVLWVSFIVKITVIAFKDTNFVKKKLQIHKLPAAKTRNAAIFFQ